MRKTRRVGPHHPLRTAVEVTLIAAQRPTSVTELALFLRSPVPRISYHVDVLAASGVVEPAEWECADGELIPFYRLAI